MKEVKHPPVGYVDLADSALVENDVDPDKHLYFPLRPSSAGKCCRSLFYDLQIFNGEAPRLTKPKEPNVIRLLSLGHSIEYSMINSLRAMCDKFGFQIKYKQQVVSVFTLDDGRIIQGSTDFCLESDEYKCICDAKSKKDKFSVMYKTMFDEDLDKYSKFKSLEKISPNCFYAEDLASFLLELGNDFKLDNVLQLNSYACAEFFVERGYDHAALIYYNKNDSRLMEIRFKPDPMLVELVKDKFQKAYDAKSEKEAPKTYKLGSIRCAFCDHNKKCWGDEDPLKKWFKTLPKKTFPKDLNRIKGKAKLGKLFKEFEKLNEISKDKKQIESDICEILSEKKIDKIKLDNGNVYQVKLLKSPHEHLELRRSKV